MSPVTVVCPRGDVWAGIAAQIEAGLVRVVWDHRGDADRRSGDERRHHNEPLPVGVGGRRATKRRRIERRQAAPLPVGPRVVVTP